MHITYGFLEDVNLYLNATSLKAYVQINRTSKQFKVTVTQFQFSVFIAIENILTRA